MLARARAHSEVVVEIHRVNDEGAAGAEAATAGQLRERRAPFRDPADLIEAGDGLRASADGEGDFETDHRRITPFPVGNVKWQDKNLIINFKSAS
jgi:hypothetical protein